MRFTRRQADNCILSARTLVSAAICAHGNMSYIHSGSVLFQKQRLLCAEHLETKSAPKPLQNTLHGKRALDIRIRVHDTNTEHSIQMRSVNDFTETHCVFVVFSK